MRVAALYDIHGNLPALEAVLQDIRQADVNHVVVGGDVLPGPMPRETLTCLLNLDIPVQFIQGNGDCEVLAWMRGTDTGTLPEQAREVLRWVAQQLHPEHERMLASWPKTLRLEIRGLGEVLFCHATPRSDTEIFTRLTPEERLLPVFEGLNAPLVICGHTHMQFDRTIGRVRVVNAGSVGMPYGEPGAYWLLLGPDVQLRHTSYDLTRAVEHIRDTEYPQAQDFAERNVLQPPSEGETLEVFTQVEFLTFITADMDRLIAFYERVFGARVTVDLGEEGLRHAFIEVGPHTVLQPFQVPGIEPSAPQPMFQRGRLDPLRAQHGERGGVP